VRAIIEINSLSAVEKRREPRPLPRLKKDLEDVVEAKKEASIGNVRLKLRHKKSSSVGGQLGTAHVKVHVQVRHTALMNEPACLVYLFGSGAVCVGHNAAHTSSIAVSAEYSLRYVP
jgi:hypothetical protein